jgi:hypothetical protein
MHKSGETRKGNIVGEQKISNLSLSFYEIEVFMYQSKAAGTESLQPLLLIGLKSLRA